MYQRVNYNRLIESLVKKIWLICRFVCLQKHIGSRTPPRERRTVRTMQQCYFIQVRKSFLLHHNKAHHIGIYNWHGYLNFRGLLRTSISDLEKKKVKIEAIYRRPYRAERERKNRSILLKAKKAPFVKTRLCFSTIFRNDLARSITHDHIHERTSQQTTMFY